GLPDWVFAGAVLVMALGLPGILLTAANASPHLNWRRVTLGGAYAFGAFVLLVGIYMVLRAAGIGPAGSLLAAGTFKDRARLVVSDFAIHGNAVDSSLVTVVSEAVRSALSQSEVVSALAPAQISGALTRMQRAPNTRLDVSLAREVAQREGAKAV